MVVYACPKERDNPQRCDMFLWESDAKPREERARRTVLRTEPGRSVESTPTKPPTNSPDSPPPPYSQSSSSATATQQTAGPGDEFSWEQEDGRFNNEVDGAMATVGTPRRPTSLLASTTPHRRAGPRQDHLTKSLQTPSTSLGGSRNAVPEHSAPSASYLTTPLKRKRFEGPLSDITPSPFRFRSSQGSESHARDDDEQIVDSVFDVLGEEATQLGTDTVDALQQMLAKHSLRVQGIIKGREVSRLGLAAKEAKIAELQHRVAALEAELEAERAASRHVRWQAENGQLSEET